MKKIYFLVIALFVINYSEAQIVNIPDAAFKSELLKASPTNFIAKDLGGNYFKIDANNNGEIEVIEALQVSYMSIYHVNPNPYVYSLEGILSFSNLQYLRCINHYLSSLNLNGLVNLRYLICFNNKITSLNVSGLINLIELDCSDNQLSSIDVRGLIKLQIFYCNYNQLSSLNLDGVTNIQKLVCSSNKLLSLNVSSLLDLQVLACGNNQLSSLDVHKSVNLKTLTCEHNQINSLNITDLFGIEYLSCLDNQLQSLDVSNLIYLKNLFCNNNQLTSLYIKNGIKETVNFFNNPNLKYICADEEQIPQIQLQINSYGYIDCVLNSSCELTIPNFAFTNYFTLYPNPVNESLNIVTTKEIEVKSIAVYNILGQLVLSLPNVKVISKIDVSNLKAGNYFVKINTDKGSSSIKFIKN